MQARALLFSAMALSNSDVSQFEALALDNEASLALDFESAMADLRSISIIAVSTSEFHRVSSLFTACCLLVIYGAMVSIEYRDTLWGGSPIDR